MVEISRTKIRPTLLTMHIANILYARSNHVSFLPWVWECC